jgi:hypothetical protein
VNAGLNANLRKPMVTQDSSQGKRSYGVDRKGPESPGKEWSRAQVPPGLSTGTTRRRVFLECTITAFADVAQLHGP